MKQRVITLWLAVLAAGLGVAVFAVQKTQAEEAAIPVESARKFVDIIEKVKLNYVTEVTDEQLFEYAIRGMMNGLDPHSSYLDNSENNELQIRTRGEFGGLGIQITRSPEGFVRVISPIDDTPAARAGIQAQDLIIRLDGKPIQGNTLEEVLDVMRGAPGTSITLTIAREGTSAPFDVTIVRDIIRIRSVRGSVLSKGFGYLRISSFQSRTGSDVAEAFARLQEEAGPLQGLVLDLRNNPGGLLPAAIQVSDFFLPKETLVVYTEGRAPGTNQKFYTEQDDLSQSIPLVVLINGGSASASEIVAGALQDHKRAIILGTKSFGKGSVQTILPYSTDQAIKLTTALFFSPHQRSIQAEGISPDIEVVAQLLEDAPQANNPGLEVSEADLNKHLENATPELNQEQPQEESVSAPELKDQQVFEAYKVLQAISIYSSR